jgi:hypothetical protein
LLPCASVRARTPATSSYAESRQNRPFGLQLLGLNPAQTERMPGRIRVDLEVVDRVAICGRWLEHGDHRRADRDARSALHDARRGGGDAPGSMRSRAEWFAMLIAKSCCGHAWRAAILRALLKITHRRTATRGLNMAVARPVGRGLRPGASRMTMTATAASGFAAGWTARSIERDVVNPVGDRTSPRGDRRSSAPMWAGRRPVGGRIGRPRRHSSRSLR